MALSKEEREQFLAEPHIAALSVSAGDKRGPLTVPIWYQYTPGGEPWVITGVGSRKHRLIETQGEFTLMAERLEPTVRYVAVDGPVSRIEPGTDEQLVEMTKRYLPPDKVDAYLEFARREHGESVAIFLKPAALAVGRPRVDLIPCRRGNCFSRPSTGSASCRGTGTRSPRACGTWSRATSALAPGHGARPRLRHRRQLHLSGQARLAGHRRGLRRQGRRQGAREGGGQQGRRQLRPSRRRPA